MRVLAATLAVLLLVAICSPAEADHRVSRNAAFSVNGRFSFPRREPHPHCLDPHGHGQGWEQMAITSAGTKPEMEVFQGMCLEDTARVMANPLGATGRVSAAVWGLTGPMSLPSQKTPYPAASGTFHALFHSERSALPM